MKTFNSTNKYASLTCLANWSLTKYFMMAEILNSELKNTLSDMTSDAMDNNMFVELHLVLLFVPILEQRKFIVISYSSLDRVDR